MASVVRKLKFQDDQPSRLRDWVWTYRLEITALEFRGSDMGLRLSGLRCELLRAEGWRTGFGAGV